MINFLLGAGFAQGFNLPGTDAITDHVRSLTEYTVEADEHQIASTSGVLWKIASSYYDSPNFETLLHVVECMLSIRKSRLGFALLDSRKVAYNAFMDPMPRLFSILTDNGLEYFGSQMMARVADFLDQEIANSSIEKQPVIRDFFDGVSGGSALRVSTLNYDDSIERSVPNIWDGFTNDDPGEIDYQGFSLAHQFELLHLHGSIRFAAAEPTTPPKGPELRRFKNNVEAKPHRSLSTQFNALTQAGELIFTGPMLSGLRKTEKLVIEPYGLYHHRFVNGLLDSPRLVCIGYGGGDIYVNSAITRARKYHKEGFKIVYVTKVEDNAKWSDPRVQQSLLLPASHSISYWNEWEAFVARLLSTGRCLEENGMLLIATGFPVDAQSRERIRTFLQ